MVVYPRPSSLHPRRVERSTHAAVRGVHVHGVQRPAEHDCDEAQVVASHALPRASQARACVRSTHSLAPGTQTRARQVPSAAHHCAPVQSTSVTQSAHRASTVLQTCPNEEHSRLERHMRGGGAQTLPRHTAPPTQSTSATQSTQNPSAVSQTCPGHMRELTHDVVGTQRFCEQVVPAAAQSEAVTHCAQTPRARSQTPRPAQSASAVQGVAPSEGASSGASEGASEGASLAASVGASLGASPSGRASSDASVGGGASLTASGATLPSKAPSTGDEHAARQRIAVRPGR